MEISLRRRHALFIEHGAFSHKIDLFTIFFEILYLDGHQNRTTGSRVKAILLNGLILPICEASAVEDLLSTGPTPPSFEENRKDKKCRIVSKVTSMYSG